MQVFYLTGASGFVGQVIAAELEMNEQVTKVYCPIRKKAGKAGKERFHQCVGKLSKCVYLSLQDHIPSDVTHIILNAYNTSFFDPVDQKLKDSVEPILALLDECEQLEGQVQGISIVSTAFVQPPLPLQHPDNGRLPWTFDDLFTPSELYKQMVHGNLNWQKFKDEYGDAIGVHYRMNCYAFSKYIMEHVVSEQHPSLPVCFVRPSIVAPSGEKNLGFDAKAGIPLFIKLASKKFLPRTFPTKGALNIVAAEDTANDCINAATKWAAPADRQDAVSDKLWHPIRMATAPADITVDRMYKAAAAPLWRGGGTRLRTVFAVRRNTEKVLVRAKAGKRGLSAYKKVVQAYDPFFGGSWNFPETHLDRSNEILALIKSTACENKKQ